MTALLAIGMLAILAPRAASVDQVWRELDGSASPSALLEGIENSTLTGGTLRGFSTDAGPDGSVAVVTAVTTPGTASSTVRLMIWDGTLWQSAPPISALSPGGPLTPDARDPDVALLSNGDAIVVWEERDTILAARWDGAGWSEVGDGSNAENGISLLPLGSSLPSVDVGPDDLPVVAWAQAASASTENLGQIYVRRFNGADWEEMGDGSASGVGISDAPDDSSQPKVAIGPMGKTIVAWIHFGDKDSGFRNIYLRQWTGSRWDGIHTSAVVGGVSDRKDTRISGQLDVAVNSDGVVYVSWLTNLEGVHVRRGIPGGVERDGWDSVGLGSDKGAGISGRARTSAMALDPSGNPIVTWIDFQTRQLLGRRWDGSKWIEISPQSVSESGVTRLPFHVNQNRCQVLPTGEPVVIWEVTNIYAHLLSGETWFPLGEGSITRGGVSGTGGVVEHPALASDRWGNLALTWSERDHLQDASSNILVKRWNGETWAEFREGDAEGGGISNTSLYSHDPHMAIDSIGLPTVVWVERETTFQRRSHIHVRSWDGEDWIEAGPNSASGMGISGSNGRNPTQPDIGIDAAGRPVVAWVNGNLNNQNQYDESNIFVRRRSGLTWEELGLHSATGGGISNSQRVSEAPSVAFDEEDRVIVAWEEVREFIPGAPFLLEIDIYVRRFDGVAWTELGMGSATGRGVTRDVDGLNTNPSISMNVSGDPILTWENLNYTGSLNREIRVRRFDGTAWVDEFGEAVPGSFLSEEDDFTYSHVSRADAQGGLTVAWRRWNLDTGESTLFAARNSGESWFEIGEGSALGAGVLFRETALPAFGFAVEPNGAPALAWPEKDTDIYLRTAGTTPLRGDPNGDGRTDVADVIRLQNHFAGDALCNFSAVLNADVDDDGNIDTDDVDALLSLILGN